MTKTDIQPVTTLNGRPSVPAFPPSFHFGFATASAQIESGATDGGRGPSIWDDFCARPDNIRDGTSVADSCDHFNLFKEDITLMKSLGVNSYRFSLSWSRIIPGGGQDDPVSEAGIAFYDALINECLSHDITPFATLYHWDLPLALQQRYGGWQSREILPDFVNYARVCFERFGDRVQNWITINEPWCVAVLGHSSGVFAPGIKSTTAPWIVGHHLILAHAHTARLYQSTFKADQGGQIGITLNGDWSVPFDNSPENVKATQDKMDAAIGWFADPIYLGYYPQSMIDRLGDRLPKFTSDEIALVHGSSEFYGCNTYTTNTIKAGGTDEVDAFAILGFDTPDGQTSLGTLSEERWLQDVPWGFRALLKYLGDRYQKPIYVTENGFAVKGESAMPKAKAIHDEDRVNFYRGYLGALRDAVVLDKVDVRSYFGWSFIDNFEWASGLTTRFGSVYVDFTTKERTLKDSATIIPQFFKDNAAPA